MISKRKPGRPRPDEGPLVKISLDIDPRALSKLDRIARREGYSRQSYLRLLIASAVQHGGQE